MTFILYHNAQKFKVTLLLVGATMALLILLMIIVLTLVPPSSCVGGEFEFIQNAMKKNSKDHELWCYEETHCKQGSANSSWERGVCKLGWNQSPINLNPRLKVSAKDSQDLKFSKEVRALYDLTEYKLEHKGHTVSVIPPQNHKIQFEWPERHGGTYRLEEIHFHWGNTNQVGSEHMIDMNSYGMEIHLVHYRTNGPPEHRGYASIQEAVMSGDRSALVVIAIIVHVDYTRHKSSFLEPIAKALPKISHEGDTMVIKDPKKALKLGELLQKEKQAFLYEGSLTTPPCSEIVMWMICRHPVQAREKEVATFRHVRTYVSKTENPQAEMKESANFRKVQPNFPKPAKGKGGKGHIHVRLIELL